jgi:hypothetical protein
MKENFPGENVAKRAAEYILRVGTEFAYLFEAYQKTTTENKIQISDLVEDIINESESEETRNESAMKLYMLLTEEDTVVEER